MFAYKILYRSDNEYIISVFCDSTGTATYSYLFRVNASN